MDKAISRDGLYFSEYGFDIATRQEISSAPGRRPERAVCDAESVLTEQMVRYLNGSVKGRSCLIAGPRGSGKTTLIDTAHHAAGKRVKKVIPVIVRLHGPSLLLAPEQDKPVTERRKEELLFEHILRCLIVNLYQTAAEE